MKKYICMFVMFVMLTGCAHLGAVLTAVDHPIVRVTTQYAIIKYLQNDADKASEAERIVTRLIEATESGVVISVADIEDMALEMIPWDSLDVADQYLLMSMLATVSDLMREKVSDGYLNEEDQVKAVEFLTWIKQAIELAQNILSSQRTPHPAPQLPPDNPLQLPPDHPFYRPAD